MSHEADESADDSAKVRVESIKEFEEKIRAISWERLGFRNAPLGRRIIANLIDLVIMAGPVALLLSFILPAVFSHALNGLYWPWLTKRPDFVLLLIGTISALVYEIVLAIVQWIMMGLRGASIGKVIAKLRLIRTNDDDPVVPGLWRVLLRSLLIFAFNIPVVIGAGALFASIFVDPEKRGRSWADRTTRMWLTDRKHGLDVVDRSAIRQARHEAVRVDERRESVPSLSTAYGGAFERYLPSTRSRLGLVAVERDEIDSAPSLSNMVKPPAGLVDALQAAQMADRAPESPRQQSAAGAESTKTPDADVPASAYTYADAVPAMRLGTHTPPGGAPAAGHRDEPARDKNGAGTSDDLPEETSISRPVAYRQESASDRPDTRGGGPESAMRASRTRQNYCIRVGDQTYPLHAGAVIGRRPTERNDRIAAIAINDESKLISKEHAEITREGDRFLLRDLESVNGTFVESYGRWERISAEHPVLVRPGTRMGIGDFVVTIEVDNGLPDGAEQTMVPGEEA